MGHRDAGGIRLQTASPVRLKHWTAADAACAHVLAAALRHIWMCMCATVQVCFLTSAARGSGTDSTVGFELRGSKGSSGPITVSAGHSAFQRGSSDTFSYRRPHLGQLQQLMVWHDNSGASTPGGRGPWGLDAVVVSCKADQQVVTFPFGGWLSPETKLKVQLAPGQAKGPTRCGKLEQGSDNC